MATSTLVVGFSELSVESFQSVVTARGIDRVIVVGSNTDFSGDALGAATSKAASVQSAGIEVLLSQQDSSISISKQKFADLRSSGLTFLVDPGLDSFSEANTFLLPASWSTNGHASYGSEEVVFNNFNFDSLTLNSIGSEAAFLTNAFTTQPTFTVSGGFDSNQPASDLGGTIKVNFTAAEFVEYLREEANSEFSNPSNLVVTDQPEASITFAGYGVIDCSVSQFNSFTSKVSNHQVLGEARTTPGGANNNFRWNTGGTIDAEHALLLPNHGILPGTAGAVELVDTAANISLVLPQLTIGQLSSFNSIRTSNGGEIPVSLETLEKLNEAGRNGVSWATNNDVSTETLSFVVNASSISQALGNNFSTAELDNYGATLSTSNVSKISADILSEEDLVAASNLVSRGIAIDGEIRGLSLNLENGQYVLNLLQDPSSTVTTSNITLSETPANIKAVLLDPDNGSFLSGITKLESTNSPAAIEVSYSQFLSLANIDGSGNLAELSASELAAFQDSFFGTSGISFENIEFVVSGTAEELNNLFNLFGSDFSGIANGVTFRVTDGGELNLNSEQLDKLDGRVYGAVNLVDDSDGIGDSLSKAIPDSVKDIISSESITYLSVDEFRNLPAYADFDQLNILDTEINIIRALNYGTLDDRISGLVYTGDEGSDNALTLTAKQAENLGSFEVLKGTLDADGLLTSNSSALVIRDRASAIANFLESGDIPTGVSSFSLNESAGRTIYLDYNQSNALANLIQDGIADISGTTWDDDAIPPLSNDPTLSGLVFEDESLSTRLGAVESSLDDIVEDLENVTSDLNTLTSDVDAGFSAVASDISELTSDVDAGFSAVASDISELTSDVDAGFSAVASDISELTSDVDAGFSAVASDISELTSDVDAGFSAVTSDISNLTDMVYDVSENVSYLTDMVYDVSESTLDISDNVLDLASDLATLSDQVSDLSEDVSDISIDVGTIQTDELEIVKLSVRRSEGLSLEGSASSVADVLSGITGYSADITLTTAHTASQLAAINNASTGTLNVIKSANISGTVATLKEALNGISDYSGDVEILFDSGDNGVLATDINTLSNSLDLDATVLRAEDALEISGGIDDVYTSIVTNKPSLSSSSVVLTAAVTDTDGSYVEKINAIEYRVASLEGSITASAEILSELSLTAAQPLSITVNDDAESILQAGTINSIATNTTNTISIEETVIITGSLDQLYNLTSNDLIQDYESSAANITPAIEDESGLSAGKLSNVASAFDGTVTAVISGSLSNLSSGLSTENTDSITITVDDALDAETQLSDLNALRDHTSASVTASISGDLSEFATLDTAGTDSITITVDDALDAETQLSDLNALRDHTSASVTASISGDLSEFATLDTASTDSITITVDDSLDAETQLSDLNALRDHTNASVTASISGDLSEFATLDTASTDSITITVDDYCSLSDVEALSEKTSVGIITVIRDTATAFNSLFASDPEVLDEYLSTATTVQITDWSGGVADISAWADADLTATLELIVSSDLTITDAQAETLNFIDKITIDGSHELTLSADSFSPTAATSSFADLTAIESTDSSSSVVIADNADNTGSTIDLLQIESISGLGDFQVYGDSGINIIQLSTTLTTSGKAEIDLGSDSEEDVLIFNVDPEEFLSIDSTDTLEYTKVSNFATNSDSLGIYNGETELSQTVQPYRVLGAYSRDVTQSGWLLEDDISEPSTREADPSYDEVSEVREAIAGAIAATSDTVDEVLFTNYVWDRDTSTYDAYLFGASLGNTERSDLDTDDADLGVVSIAKLVDIGETIGGLSSRNLTYKPDELLST